MKEAARVTEDVEGRRDDEEMDDSDASIHSAATVPNNEE